MPTAEERKIARDLAAAIRSQQISAREERDRVVLVQGGREIAAIPKAGQGGGTVSILSNV